MWITMGEAEKIVNVARSTFRKHAKAGKFSTSTNARGFQIVQVAELERYYGALKPLANQNGNGNGQHETADVDQNGHSETTAQTQEYIEFLKSELADAKERETKLLSMLSTEQEKTKLLMLAPSPEDKKRQKRSWRDHFRLT